MIYVLGVSNERARIVLQFSLRRANSAGRARLSSFIAAVRKLFGPAQAKLAAEDWLDESDLMDSPPRSEARDWRSVTIAASARLADRVDAARYRQQSAAA